MDIHRPRKQTKKSEDRGWYRVDAVTGHRVTRIKNRDTIEFRVQWEGYPKPTWEGFPGFVKDAAHMVEKYLIKSQIRKYQQLKDNLKELKSANRSG